MLGKQIVAETDKLGRNIVLCAPEVEHVPLIVNWLNDRAVTRLLNPNMRHTTLSDELARYNKQKSSRTSVMWLITVNDVAVGLAWVLFAGTSTEFGILIGEEEYWSVGVATAVTQAITTHTFASTNAKSIAALVLDENTACRKMLDRLNFESFPLRLPHGPGQIAILWKPTWETTHHP